VKGTGWAAVEESRRVSKIAIAPDPAGELKIAAGSTIRFQAEVKDQFNARYLLPVSWTATGNVQISADGRLTAGTQGEGSVTAEAGGQKVVIAVKVVPIEQVNLAAMKSAEASSTEEAATGPEMAVDGNGKTRWASAFSDPQWIKVDLEGTYTLNRIVLNWEAAAARTYEIELSTDGVGWTSAAKITDGKPGIRTIEMGDAKARFVRVTGTERVSKYGYSLWEIEAYGRP
jgi:hypothetical protein